MTRQEPDPVLGFSCHQSAIGAVDFVGCTSLNIDNYSASEIIQDCPWVASIQSMVVQVDANRPAHGVQMMYSSLAAFFVSEMSTMNHASWWLVVATQWQQWQRVLIWYDRRESLTFSQPTVQIPVDLRTTKIDGPRWLWDWWLWA